MQKTIAEFVDDLVGARRSRRKYSDALLARVAYTYLLKKTGLKTKELSEQIVEPILASSRGEVGDSSGIAYKWEAGQLMSRKWQQRLEPHAPGLTALCEHPVFHLLGDFPITKNAAENCLSRWRGDQSYYWYFDDEEQRIAERRYVETWLRSDTQPLVERGDLDGFTVILGLMRFAEAANDSTRMFFTLETSIERCQLSRESRGSKFIDSSFATACSERTFEIVFPGKTGVWTGR